MPVARTDLAFLINQLMNRAHTLQLIGDGMFAMGSADLGNSLALLAADIKSDCRTLMDGLDDFGGAA